MASGWECITDKWIDLHQRQIDGSHTDVEWTMLMGERKIDGWRFGRWKSKQSRRGKDRTYRWPQETLMPYERRNEVNGEDSAS